MGFNEQKKKFNLSKSTKVEIIFEAIILYIFIIVLIVIFFPKGEQEMPDYSEVEKIFFLTNTKKIMKY